MTSIFDNILPIFFIMVASSIMKKKWLTSEEFWRNLEKLLYYILLPVTIFNSIAYTDFSKIQLKTLVLGLILSSSIVIFFLMWYQRKFQMQKEQFLSLLQGSFRYNNYMFLAVCSSIYGDEGFVISAAISGYMVIFCNTISISSFSIYLKEKAQNNFKLHFKRLLTNPLIIASIIGLIFNKIDMDFDFGLKKLLHILAESSLGMGIILVGGRLKMDFDAENLRQIAFATVNKLIILPMITFIILEILDVGGILKAIGVIYSCIPCATGTYILVKEMKGDVDLMASIITSGTIISIIPLSILTYILV